MAGDILLFIRAQSDGPPGALSCDSRTHQRQSGFNQNGFYLLNILPVANVLEPINSNKSSQIHPPIHNCKAFSHFGGISILAKGKYDYACSQRGVGDQRWVMFRFCGSWRSHLSQQALKAELEAHYRVAEGRHRSTSDTGFPLQAELKHQSRGTECQKHSISN